jgi:glycosyltransferase involved in cell wall biosynthesis
LRIAQVAPLLESVPPAKYGGTERVIGTLTAELVALGHDVTLYASGDSTTEARLIPMVEQALWRHPGARNDAHVHFVELSRVCRDAADYDVIHSHLDYLAFPFGRGCATRWIHTLHGRLDLPETAALFQEFDDVPVVSISDSQRRPIPNANWVRTVYNGIPVDSFPLGQGEGGYLVFLGRISPEKGVAEAIDVALAAEMPLKIAARMPLPNKENPWVALDWQYYEAEVEPRLRKSRLIEFVGEVDDREKALLLKDARAMVFPLRWPEPFGLAMTESMACGTPVITRPLGATTEIVRPGHTGFLCHTVDEMAQACHRVDDLDRSECRRVVESCFSSRAMALGYLDAYASGIRIASYTPDPIRVFVPQDDAEPEALPA